MAAVDLWMTSPFELKENQAKTFGNFLGHLDQGNNDKQVDFDLKVKTERCIFCNTEARKACLSNGMYCTYKDFVPFWEKKKQQSTKGEEELAALGRKRLALVTEMLR